MVMMTAFVAPHFPVTINFILIIYEVRNEGSYSRGTAMLLGFFYKGSWMVEPPVNLG